jgi:hypothetical protein
MRVKGLSIAVINNHFVCIIILFAVTVTRSLTRSNDVNGCVMDDVVYLRVIVVFASDLPLMLCSCGVFKKLFFMGAFTFFSVAATKGTNCYLKHCVAKPKSLLPTLWLCVTRAETVWSHNKLPNIRKNAQ